MPATFHTPQADKDFRDARMWARKGPGWLTNAKEQGRADDAVRIQGNIAWATAYLASHGASVGTKPPGASRTTSSPDADALARGRAYAASFGAASATAPSASHPKGQQPVTTSNNLTPAQLAGLRAAMATDLAAQGRAATDAMWDETVSALNAQLAPAATSPATAGGHRAGHSPQQEHADAGTSQAAIDAFWGATVAKINAEKGLTSGPF